MYVRGLAEKIARVRAQRRSSIFTREEWLKTRDGMRKRGVSGFGEALPVSTGDRILEYAGWAAKIAVAAYKPRTAVAGYVAAMVVLKKMLDDAYVSIPREYHVDLNNAVSGASINMAVATVALAMMYEAFYPAQKGKA